MDSTDREYLISIVRRSNNHLRSHKEDNYNPLNYYYKGRRDLANYVLSRLRIERNHDKIIKR